MLTFQIMWTSIIMILQIFTKSSLTSGYDHSQHKVFFSSANYFIFRLLTSATQTILLERPSRNWRYICWLLKSTTLSKSQYHCDDLIRIVIMVISTIVFRWMSQQCHCPSSMFLPVALLTMSQKTAGHFLKIIITLINIVKITFAFHMINNIFTIINKNINVSRDVCTLSIDLDLLARRPSCLPQFHQVCFHLVTFIILFKKFPVIFKEYFI